MEADEGFIAEKKAGKQEFTIPTYFTRKFLNDCRAQR
jgi:hypothetical protein